MTTRHGIDAAHAPNDGAAPLERGAVTDHPTEWNTNDFDAMSWHDVHVHGLRLGVFDSTTGSAALTLDIDYILEWIHAETGFEFVVAQALLVFHEVFGLKLRVDYAAPTSGMCPFSLGGIERTVIDCPNGSHSFRWRLPINWPVGEIEFESPGFTQRLVGPALTQPHQWLDGDQRIPA